MMAPISKACISANEFKGNRLLLHGCTLHTWKDPFKLGSRISLATDSYFKNHISRRKSCISCSYIEEDHHAPSKIQLADAKVIYSVASAIGHNMTQHPETGFRVSGILRTLKSMELTPKFRSTEIIELKHFKPASFEDICSIHENAYVLGLAKAMEAASRHPFVFIDEPSSTYATYSTFQDSLIAAGAGLAVVDSVVAASNISAEPPVGFALIRPPGHHAVPKGPMGFCFFGNVAIAARYAQCVHGLKRVFIIDFDAQHGNGTQDAFYEDPDVFFLSVHQEGVYPFTGQMYTIGSGRGEGTILNLPAPGGAGDVAMRTIFDEVIVPCAQRFKPDIILVSAGYNGHFLDQQQNCLQFTTGTYYMLAAYIKQLAKELCGGRCIFFLEGGYDLKSLSRSVADSFRAFLGESSRAFEIDSPYLFYEPHTKIKQVIEIVKFIHAL